MVDHKFSEFPVATTLDDADLLTLLHGPVNQIITWANAKVSIFTLLFTNGTDFPIAANATSSGNRSVTFTLTATTFMRLLWNQSAAIFQLVNQAGSLQKLAVANATGSTHAITKAQLDSAVTALTNVQVFTQSFTSSPQPIMAGPTGNLTLAHGLSATPFSFECFLINTTAEFGYSIGDVIPVNPSPYFSTIGRGQVVMADGTDVFVYFTNSGAFGVHSLLNLTTNADQALTDANWNFIVTAYA